jgi:hypothetical protein
VLTNPFPHNHHLASSSSNAENAPSGSQNPPPQDGDHISINMVDVTFDISTRSRDYGSSKSSTSLEAPPPPPEMNLQIKKLEPLPRIPKGVFKCSTHNPNARVTQNYSIVEDLGKTPYAMFALEVLQMCPSQRNALLSALGALEPSGSKIIKFDAMDVKPHLPYHVAFQIHVEYSKYTIKRAVVDEGVATCVMSLVCWKAIGSPTLSKFSTMLTAFDDHSFRPHSILPTFSVQLGGKTVEVEVEVVDAPLDYNMLLGCNWNYAMVIVVSSIFHTLCFPHQGEIVTIDQLSFVYSSPNASIGLSFPVVDNSQPANENIDVGMYSSLMGTFDFSAPTHHIYAMSSMPASVERSIPFRTSYFSNPWTLPSLNSSIKGQSHVGMAMPLSTTKISYQAILDSYADPDHVPSQTVKEDPVLRPVWATSLSCSHHFLDETLPLDEAILEAMNVYERPWDNMHHQYYFLPSLERIEQDDFRSTLSEIVGHVVVPLDTHGIYVEGNMASISPTIQIDISCTPGKIENVNIGADCSPEEILIYTNHFKEFQDIFTWSYEEMPWIDPRIVEHEIRTYPDAKLI